MGLKDPIDVYEGGSFDGTKPTYCSVEMKGSIPFPLTNMGASTNWLGHRVRNGKEVQVQILLYPQ
jgi:hypothetical protein